MNTWAKWELGVLIYVFPAAEQIHAGQQIYKIIL